MKFQVWYRNDEHSRSASKVTEKNINPEHYHKVGFANGFNLAELWRRMNCVDGSAQEYVGRGKKFEARSMSVGDIAIDETGRGYLCVKVGWTAFDASIFSGKTKWEDFEDVIRRKGQ